MNSRNKCPK